MKRYKPLYVVCLFLVGCSRGTIPLHSVHEQHDNIATGYSYVERVRIVPVTITLPAQSASYTGPELASHLETDVAQSEAYVDSVGLLHHTLTNKAIVLRDSVPVTDSEQAYYRDSSSRSSISEDKAVKVIKTKEVYRQRWWQRWLIYIGIASLLRVVIKLIINRNQMSLKTILKSIL